MKNNIALTIGFLAVVLGGFLKIGTPVWSGQYLILCLFLYIWLALYLWEFNKFLTILILVCIFSVFFRTQCTVKSISMLNQIVFLSFLSHHVSKMKNYKWLIGMIAGIVLMQFMWIVLQYFNIDPMFKPIDGSRDKLVAFMGSPDQMGAFFAITLPLMCYINPVLGLVSLIGIIISKSSFAIMAGVLAGSMYFLKTGIYKLKLWVIIGVISSIIIFFGFVEKITGADFQMRFSVWKHAVQSVTTGKISVVINERPLQAITNPVFGYGMGNFPKLFPHVPQSYVENKFNYMDEKFTHAHNDYVETFFELGYLGLMSLLLLLGGWICDFFKKNSKEAIMCGCCVSSYLLCATGNFVSQIAVLGFLLSLFYGMFKGVSNGPQTGLV